MSLRIVRLQARNIKRLVAVDISPRGDVVRITGKNGAGKSSVLDSIWYALAGGRAIPEKPLRDGEKKGGIELDLGKLVVRRTFSDKGTTSLTVTSADGKSVKTPQKVLDKLVGSLTFDPLAFTREKPAKQAEVLRDLCGIDTRELDAEHDQAYEERRDLGRDLKRLEAQEKGIQVPPDAPTEEESAAEVLREIESATAHNRRIGDRVQEQARLKARIGEIEDEIERLQGELAEAAELLKDLAQPMEGRDDVDALREKLARLEERNAAAREYQKREEIREQVRDLQDQVDAREKVLDKVAAKKRALIEQASFPLEGLAVDADRVLYRDLPLEQASQAEQLRVSAAIAMALNPKLRILRITDGSLLDSASMAILEELAGENDFQVWVEVVDDSAEVGIVIEDGQVAETKEARRA